MANSLRNKIKHLCYKGELNERERDRILNALDDTELKQQPCEDCISRQRVLNDLENVIKGSEHPRQVFVFVDECVDYITSVPSVTPKAEWIPDRIVIDKNLCDSCITEGCIFQSGIVRNYCDFYKAESEDKE